MEGMSEQEEIAWAEEAIQQHESEIRDVKENHLNGDPVEMHVIIQEACEAHQNEVDEFLGRTVYSFEGINPAEKDAAHGQPATTDDLQLDQRVESTEAMAKEAHDGTDGLPTYDEVVDTHVVDLIRRKPEVFEVLRQMDNPAESAFMLGLMIEYPNAADLLEAGRQINDDDDDFVERLNGTSEMAGKYAQFLKDFTEAAKRAASRRSGVRPKPVPRRTGSTGKYDNMSNAAFAQMLDQWHAEGMP